MSGAKMSKINPNCNPPNLMPRVASSDAAATVGGNLDGREAREGLLLAPIRDLMVKIDAEEGHLTKNR